MSILIKNVLLNNRERDILIEDNKITQIGKINQETEYKIDGKNKAVIPSFINAHTHAAMTLMRGYADDMETMEWLKKKIWPVEVNLKEEDVYWGTKLACLEMIKSGTTFFNDMYWHYDGIAKAVEEMRIRAGISTVFVDRFNKKDTEKNIKRNIDIFRETNQYSNRIKFVLGPHAIYTVSKEALQWAKDFSDKHNTLIHIHLSETKQEVEDCIKKHNLRPVEYLEDIGFLGPNVIAAHAIWLNDNEINILKKHDVKLVYNPTSNMKLSSGIFPYEKLKHLTIGLGTDGCASNNNLDMFEEMKFATLLQKINNHPITLPANEIFDIATKNGAKIFNLNCGEIEEGKLADLLLINLKHIHMNPRHNLISNLVYSGNGSFVDTTICDGKILMENRKVKDEELIVEKANDIALKLVKKKWLGKIILKNKFK